MSLKETELWSNDLTHEEHKQCVRRKNAAENNMTRYCLNTHFIFVCLWPLCAHSTSFCSVCSQPCHLCTITHTQTYRFIHIFKHWLCSPLSHRHDPSTPESCSNIIHYFSIDAVFLPDWSISQQSCVADVADVAESEERGDGSGNGGGGHIRHTFPF